MSPDFHEGTLAITRDEVRRKGICYVIHDSRGRRIASDPDLEAAKAKAKWFLVSQGKTFDGFTMEMDE